MYITGLTAQLLRGSKVLFGHFIVGTLLVYSIGALVGILATVTLSFAAGPKFNNLMPTRYEKYIPCRWHFLIFNSPEKIGY